MSRIVLKTAHAPFVIPASDKPTRVCMCGLAKDQPFCDDSHKKTLDEKEEEVYEYDKKGNRVELSEEAEEGGCCGGGCCGGGNDK